MNDKCYKTVTVSEHRHIKKVKDIPIQEFDTTTDEGMLEAFKLAEKIKRELGLNRPYYLRAIEYAKKMLETDKLPNQEFVYHLGGKKWAYELPKNKDEAKRYSLDRYIRKVGKEYPEKQQKHFLPEGRLDLLARIVTKSFSLERYKKNEELELAINEAFEIGTLFERYLVFSFDASKGGVGGKANKRKKWAEWVAEQVTCWEDISEFEYEEDYTIYRDGNTLVKADACNADAKPDTLKRSTFEKRYLKKR